MQSAQIKGEGQIGAGQSGKVDQGGIEHVDKEFHLRSDDLDLAQMEFLIQKVLEAVAEGDPPGVELPEDEEVIAGGGVRIRRECNILKDEAAQGMEPDLAQREAAIQFFDGRLVDHGLEPLRRIEKPQSDGGGQQQDQKGEKGEEKKSQQTARPGAPAG